jgi:60 kDa SS-A/Ro ribonucleoprotein
MDPLSLIGTRRNQQTEQADPRQRRNAAGGYTFVLDDLARLRRFLVLGVDGGTYYAGERELTKDNAEVVLELARTRGSELVAEIVAISTGGRAPKQNPALFALAAATALGDEDGRRAALDALPLVARTGTHLFLFAGYVEQFRGWGRGLRRAVGRWYTGKPVDEVAFQAVKYRQRDGWTHRDLLRLAHPGTDEPGRKALFDWICGRGDADGVRLVEGFRLAQAATEPARWASLVGEYGLSWEMLPDAALSAPVVWEALLDKGMPQTALLRQLPRLTRLGLLDPLGGRTAAVARQLTDPARLRSARVHPVNVLAAHLRRRRQCSRLGDVGAVPDDRGRPGRGVLRGVRRGRAVR